MSSRCCIRRGSEKLLDSCSFELDYHHISHQSCLFQAEESWSVASCMEMVPDLVNYF